MSDQPKIILTLPSGEVRKYSLQMDSIRLGRAPDNTVVLEDASLSSHHAVLHRRESGFEIIDLGSTNGIEANGQRVLTHNLKHGDEIKVGSVLLRFESGEYAPTTLPVENPPPAVAAADADGLAREAAPAAKDEAPPQQRDDYKPAPAAKGGCLASAVLFLLTLLAPVLGLHLRHFSETKQILVLEIIRYSGAPKDTPPATPVPPAP